MIASCLQKGKKYRVSHQTKGGRKVAATLHACIATYVGHAKNSYSDICILNR